MKEKRDSHEAKVEMTPMIDVVFQLLIFFVVTLKQEDILSRFSAARPAPDDGIGRTDIDLIDITIHKGGFIFKQTPVTIEGLDKQIGRYSRMSKTATVVIRCTKDSPQSNLIKVLDVCSKHQMKNLSIFSM
jgi:biopolymer transport protein ExbD